MIQTYEQIFLKRADAYQKAMELFPHARDHEFRLVVELACIKAGETVCDAPAGGGYLRAYLPGGIGSYLAVETAPDFTRRCPMGDADRVIESPLHQIALDDHSVDVCINLAGSHHLESKSHFFDEAARILKPGGRLVLADVEKDTAVDRYLNEFVDQHNSMGHVGEFLTPETADEIAACGFKIHSDELISFPWCFNNRHDMGLFCKLLFGMDLAERDKVERAGEDILGCVSGPGSINLNWSLRCIVALCS
jgi:SAM-dependent methyltransferase